MKTRNALIILFIATFMTFSLVACSENKQSSSSAATKAITESLVQAKEHRSHEIETVEAGKKDSNGELIDKIPAIQAANTAALITAQNAKQEEPEEEAQPEEEYYEEPVYYEDSSTYYGGDYEIPYSDLYNSDGPSRNMPGWHDGYVETYYDASAHYMAGDWTVDSEGFYHDSEGRYVVGVDINSGLQYGDVVETGKGEAVVYDYGAGVSNVHDFAVAGTPNK